MNKIRVIDLLNKIANGEEVPKIIRIDHWSYKFEWIEHDENYYDKHEDIDLMSCLSMSEEELNYGVHIIEEKEIPERVPNAEVFDVPKLNNMELSNIALTNKADIKIIKDILNKVLEHLKSKGE